MWEWHRLCSVPQFTTPGSTLLCLLPCPADSPAWDQLVTTNSLLRCITTAHCNRRGSEVGTFSPCPLPVRQILRVSPSRAPIEPQSLLRARSRENDTNDGDSFRYRLSCLLILSALQEHAALTALCLLNGAPSGLSPSGHPSCLAHYIPPWMEEPLPRSII